MYNVSFLFIIDYNGDFNKNIPNYVCFVNGGLSVYNNLQIFLKYIYDPAYPFIFTK